MPRTARELNNVRQINKPGRYRVGRVPGLCLKVAPSGAKHWILRVAINGKRRDLGLGSVNDLPLKEAREKARQVRKEIFVEGRDPIEEKRKARAVGASREAKTMTFDECVRQFLAAKQSGWQNAKHRRQWASTLENYAGPVIGKLPVSEIELPHVLKILEPIWPEKPETAKRLRGRIENVLAWATTRGYRSGDNPARWRGHLDTLLPIPSRLRPVRHFRALPMDDLPGFMTALRQREGTAALAVEFAILTAARSGEVRGARWEEIDMDKRLWTIPAERMKARREHVAPLSEAALAVLKKAPRLASAPELVFPGARGCMLSDMSLSAVLRRMEVPATVHGFRSTFRDWCAERTGYPHEVAEMALAHAIPNGVERAYRRGDLLTKRTRLMEAWAKFAGSPPTTGNVAKLKAAG